MSGRACAALCPAIDMPLVTCTIVEAVDENLKDFELHLLFTHQLVGPEVLMTIPVHSFLHVH